MHGSGGRGRPAASQVWRADLHGAAPLALLADKPHGLRSPSGTRTGRTRVSASPRTTISHLRREVGRCELWHGGACAWRARLRNRGFGSVRARAQAPGPVVSSQVRNSFAGLRKRKSNDPYQAGRPVKAMGQGEEPGASGDGSCDRNAAFAPLDVCQCADRI